MQDFYDEVIAQLLRAGVLDTAMTVLVVCGGQTDKAVLLSSGFGDVVISSID